MDISNFKVTAVELDMDKKYIFILDRSVSAMELIAFREALMEGGFAGLVWRGPLNVIDYDQIKGYVEVDE